MRETMMQVRAQSILTARLREKVGGQTISGLRALRLSDMPHAGREAAGIDVQMIKQEELIRQLQNEEARLKRMERKARAKMAGMRLELYTFCAAYYLNGMSILETAEQIDRSERQCMRYKQEIEGAGNRS